MSRCIRGHQVKTFIYLHVLSAVSLSVVDLN